MNANSTLPARADGHGASNGQSRRDWYRTEYLQSDHWRTTRQAALQRAGHRCQVCNGAKNLDVHHRTYERLGQEQPEDLTVLCRSCHELFHDSRRIAPARPTRTAGVGQNWSEMDAAERAAFTQRVLHALTNGPRTSRDIAQELRARPQAVGSCLASCHRRHKVARHRKTWRLAGTPAAAPTKTRPTKKGAELQRENDRLHALQQENRRKQAESARTREPLTEWRRDLM